MKPELQKAVDLLKQPDPAVIEQALSLLQSTVYSFSMKVCGHREDAEDTAQDVLIRSLPYLPKFDSPQALSVWLYKTARNRCVSAHRRSRFAPKAQQQLSLDELMPDGRELESLLAADRPSPEASIASEESSERVRDAVLKLPPAYRLVLVLHDMEELDTDEVARVLDLRPGTVRVRLHRARLFVRRELSRPRGKRTAPAAAGRAVRCRGLFAQLSDYLDGLVDDATCEQMQVHLGDCQPCAAFVDSLRQTVEKCAAYQPGYIERPVRYELVRQYAKALEALQSRKRIRAGKRKVLRSV